jgi:two-component system response regulator YesN
MLKVYFVDDEELILDELKSLIDWNKYGFNIVGCSTDGETAYKDIIALQPHLVISDINMPMMNGLSLFEKVQDSNPLIKFCYLSAYDNFEYVQQALKLGAISYLKKPIMTSELISLLKETTDNFDNEFSSKLFEAEVSRQFIENDPYLKQLFVENAFIKRDEKYRILTFAHFDASKVDEQLLSCHGLYKLYDDGKMRVDLLYGARMDKLQELASKQELSLGLSEEFTTFDKVSRHLRFSRIAAFQDFISGRPELTVVSDNPGLEVVLSDINGAKNAYELQQIVASLKEEIVRYDIKCYDLQAIYRITMFNLIKFGVVPFDFKFDEVSVINNYDNLDGLVKDLNSAFDCSEPSEAPVSVVDQVKSEIEGNLHEHYTLSYFAEKYHYNLSYFSQLFKKESGCSFAEYVANVKMNSAKLLIANSLMSLSEIAEHVGYNDYYHFSKMFKKITNSTPSDYSKANRLER